MVLDEEVNSEWFDENGIGLLVIGDGKLVNNGGEGGDGEGNTGFILKSSCGDEDSGKDDEATAVENGGGGMGRRLDNASETFGFGWFLSNAAFKASRLCIDLEILNAVEFALVFELSSLAFLRLDKTGARGITGSKGDDLGIDFGVSGSACETVLLRSSCRCC